MLQINIWTQSFPVVFSLVFLLGGGWLIVSRLMSPVSCHEWFELLFVAMEILSPWCMYYLNVCRWNSLTRQLNHPKYRHVRSPRGLQELTLTHVEAA